MDRLITSGSREKKKIPTLYRDSLVNEKFREIVNYKEDYSLRHVRYLAQNYYVEDKKLPCKKIIIFVKKELFVFNK